MTIVEAARGVTGGVDTHLDVHVAAALDPLGALLGSESFATTPAGYQSLLAWLESFGDVTKVGVEGTGSCGAGLARFLHRAHIEVIEVDRPNRAERRRSGKSDPLDAVEAARAALGGRATSISKSKDSAVEAIRALVVAKRSARGARIKALTQMRHLVITAPTSCVAASRASRLRRWSATGRGSDRRALVMRSWRHTRRRCVPWRTESKNSTTRSPSSMSGSRRFWRGLHPSCSPASGSVPTPRRLCW